MIIRIVVYDIVEDNCTASSRWAVAKIENLGLFRLFIIVDIVVADDDDDDSDGDEDSVAAADED